MNTQPETNLSLQSAAKNIDFLSKSAMEAFASPESFEKELAVAQSVNQLREALTPDIMKQVMSLMNTSIGFDTDRNPKKVKPGEAPVVPYTEEVVKDCFIEARLRGFHVIGKEFSIISGNFYGGVNGLDRLVRKHPKVTNFRDNYDIPRAIGDSGASVQCKAEWIQEGCPQTLERTFAVRVNKGQGADAILGKAKRKLLAAVYSRLSGVVVPEGEVDEPITPAATPAKTETVAPEALFTAPKTPEPAKPIQGVTVQSEFARFMSECGVTFDDFRSFCVTKSLGLKNADSIANFDEVPAAFIVEFRGQPKTVAELVKKFGTKPQQTTAAK